MKKFLARIQGVLPEGEIPFFMESLSELQAKPRKSLRLNTLVSKNAVDHLAQYGIQIEGSVPWCKEGYFFDLKSLDRPQTHPLLGASLFFIQEAGAMEVVEELDVQPGHQVLDLCAAPGAKSTHIGEKLKGQGLLTANDPHRDRAKTLSVLLSRHGVSNSTVYQLEPHELALRFPAHFDRILVDAPCSGESLFAKRKEKRFDVSHREVSRCADRQRAILSDAAKMAKVGARVVYSTCTYSREENEEVIQDFLKVHPEFKLLREKRRWPHKDHVAGGYLAVLEKTGAMEFGSSEMIEPNSPRLQSTHGLIRTQTKRWNGEEDLFTRAMSRVDTTCDWPFLDIPREEMDRARKFLSGEVSIFGNTSEAGYYRVRWSGQVIGIVERTSKSWIHRTPLK